MEHPKAHLIAHPECEDSLLRRADFIGSTWQLLKYVIESPVEAFIVATEAGILHQMQKRAPTKKLISAPPNQNCACNDCPFMKLNTLDKIILALENDSPEVTVSADIQAQALIPLERMLEWSK